jgi:hypothetical protein
MTAQGKQSAYRTKPCRYDQVGYCRSGAACPFKHSQEHDLEGEIYRPPVPNVRFTDLDQTVQLRWRTQVALETHPDHCPRALEVSLCRFNDRFHDRYRLS